MHDNPIPSSGIGHTDDVLARAILDLLTIDHPGVWSMTDLDRAVSPSGAPPCTRAEDAVESLHAAGLIHRCGAFVFASRAAHEAQRLAG